MPVWLAMAPTMSWRDRQQRILRQLQNSLQNGNVSTKAIAHSTASNLAVSNLAVVELAAFDSVVGDLVATDSVVSEASNSGVVDLATFNLPSQMIHN